MRLRRLAGLFLFAVPLAALPQSVPKPSFVVKLKYIKVDLPRQSSSTCVVVLEDGRFHMEQIWEWPYSAPRITEGSLPSASVEALSKILEEQDLKNLKNARATGEIAQGGMVWAVIPREQATQRLAYFFVEASGGHVPKPLPAPCFRWFSGFTPQPGLSINGNLHRSRTVNRRTAGFLNRSDQAFQKTANQSAVKSVT